MQNKNEQQVSQEYVRLKEINNELSRIVHLRKDCRSKTTLFGAMAGVLMAASMIILFQNLLSTNNDWQANPNSPVHEVASQEQSSTVVTVISVVGLLGGLVLFFIARGKCRSISEHKQTERDLLNEMRQLRDKMYVKDARAADHRFRPRKEEPSEPLTPDEARGEYVGVYSPPGAKKS